MSDIAFAIIDGTGPWGNKTYATEMQNSFCHQIARELGGGICNYERGPSFDGYRMNERGERAAAFVQTRLKQGAQRVFLAGYSRGAVAAVMAAEYLKTRNVQIEAVFLFDPVERHLSSGGQVVPDNVKTSYVALRDYNNKVFDQFDHSIGIGPIMHNPIRHLFGSAKLTFARTVSVKRRVFLGSHGALGGVGWKKVTFDGPCQIEVAKFMNAAFVAESVPIRIASVPPSNG